MDIIKSHNTRCYKCKNTIYKMLQHLYGEIDLKFKAEGVSTRIEDYLDSELSETLSRIYSALVNHRNHSAFVKSGTLQRCDVYIPSRKIVIETDETQHFTYPRYVALSNYPTSVSIGYDLDWYMQACKSKRAVDNDPEYRDEQRAWYDTIRDFLPLITKEVNKTVRVPLGFHIWCSLETSNADHVEIFRKHALNQVE